MKNIKKLIIPALFLLLILLSGCNKSGVTVTVAVKSEDYFDYTIAAKEYNKSGKNTVKITIQKKSGFSPEKADGFDFSLGGYDAVSEYCADLGDYSFSSAVLNKKLCFAEEGYIYGVPLFTHCAAILYNKDILGKYYSGEINGFADLEAAVRAVAYSDKKTAMFALSKEDAEGLADALLGTALYFELETGDDYNYPPHAAQNARRIALRYGENLKEFIDLYKESYKITETSRECLELLNSGGAVFTAVSSKGAGLKAVGGSIGVLPFYMEVDGEEDQGVTTFTDTYLAINKNSSDEKKKAVADFYNYLAESGEKYLKTDGAVFPYKAAKNDKNAVKRTAAELIASGKTRSVISVSGAFPKGFGRAAADALLDYINGGASFEYTESVIKQAWETEMTD